MAAMQDPGAGIVLQTHNVGNDAFKHCFSGNNNRVCFSFSYYMSIN